MGNGQQLIVAALKDEVRELKSKMSIDCTIHFKPATLYRGIFFNKETALLVTGIGSERAKKGLEQALDQLIPGSILNIGYAGGCSPIAGLGSLTLGQKIIDEKTKKSFKSDDSLLGQAKKLCDGKKWAYRMGGIVTVDRVISSPHEKADIGAVHEAIALDMEAATVSEIATAKGIPWLVVKSILDPVEMELPSLQDCVEPTGEAKPVLLVEHLVKQPKDLMKITNIQYCASQARSSLTEFVESWVQLI